MTRLHPKHSLATRLFHWTNAPVLAVMIWSGLLIYWANDVYQIRFAGVTLVKFFPTWFYRVLRVDHRLAEGMAWHFTFMWFFALNGLLYVVYTFWSGEWRELVPNRHTFAEAWQVVLHDMASALHPQTLLCYEMNGRPLTPAHGAPLRLVIPIKYGIKNLKQIGTIQFTDERPADYWAERGYDWYAGH